MRFRLLFVVALACAVPVAGTFALTASEPSAPETTGCFTDTSQSDFTSDIAAVNCDLTTTPGSVQLAVGNAIDQQNTSVGTGLQAFGLNAFQWAGQTFTAGATGTVSKVDLLIGCQGVKCDDPPPVISVSIRATDGGGLPTGADLTPAAQIPVFSGATPVATAYRTAIFGTPVPVTSGVKYAIVMRVTTGMSDSAYTLGCSCGTDANPYAAGQRVSSISTGSTWSADVTAGGRDLGFKVYMAGGGYVTNGTFTSSLKDSDPAPGGATTWGTIAWNAATPAGATLQFQVAGSNNPGGPFNFVGPDGTSGTFFTSGASLAQFNGKRYLRYQAQLGSNGSVTPSINDVTICFTKTPQRHVDLDGDETGDVFTYNPASGDWKRAIAQGDGSFTEANGMWDPSWTVAPAKFNQDNLTDVFLYNSTSGQWFRMLNDGASGFTTQASGTWWNGWQRFVMDLNGDGLSDVFLYDAVTGVWFKSLLSNMSEFEYLQGGWNPGWEITPMILNEDAFGDMFLIDRTTGRWFLMHGETGGGIEIAGTDVWFPGWNLHPGDFNGDGLADLLLHDPPTGNYFIATNDGAGTGYSYTSGGWSVGWTPHVGDLDADGVDDLFLHAPASGVWFQLISDGAGSFTTGGSGAWSLGWSVQLTDLNGDGRMDVMLYHPAAGVWYQARNFSLGTFTYTSGTWAPNLLVVVRSPY